MPSKNHVLSAYGVLRTWSQNKADEFDNKIYQNDDGEPSTIAEAKSAIGREIESMINELEDLKRKSQNQGNFKQFIDTHG